MLLAFCVLVIFKIGSHPDHNPPIYLPTVAGMTGVYHHTQLLVEMGSHELFAPDGLEPQAYQSQSHKHLGLRAMSHLHP
jgi:hypothetical protein